VKLLETIHLLALKCSDNPNSFSLMQWSKQHGWAMRVFILKKSCTNWASDHLSYSEYTNLFLLEKRYNWFAIQLLNCLCQLRWGRTLSFDPNLIQEVLIICWFLLWFIVTKHNVRGLLYWFLINSCYLYFNYPELISHLSIIPNFIVYFFLGVMIHLVIIFNILNFTYVHLNVKFRPKANLWLT